MTDEAGARASPYPDDTQAKGWRFELDLQRIRQSDTWALASPEARPWLFMLWMTAWEQTPCGSLPNDDALICARIGITPKMFAKFRSMLMRGWWLADDDRLYQNTIVERVQAMLDQKNKEKTRKHEYRLKKLEEESGRNRANEQTSNVPRDNHGTTTGRTRESDGTDDTGTGTGTSTGTGLLKTERRATRLPSDFQIPDEWIEFAKDARPDLDPRCTFEKFRDYWTAKPGKAGAKLDWLATWRNWVREERQQPKAAASGQPYETPYARSMREKYEVFAPGVAAKNPNSQVVQTVQQAAEFFELEAKNGTRTALD